jgi:hypothetical protein
MKGSQPMPETTEHAEGGSPKVAEQWPVVYVADVTTARLRGFTERKERLVLCVRRPEDTGEDLPVETYIPVSALLSDEALGYIVNELERLGWRLRADGAETCADLRAAVTDAIDHLGGTDAE